jgi:hypothetical protein
MLMVSLAWQGQHTSLAASYSRLVTGGGGLGGTYESNSVDVSGAWQVSRMWVLGASGTYSLNNTLFPLLSGYNLAGHTILGIATAQRPISEHLSIQAGYSWIGQTYREIPTASTVPTTNRVFFSISYQLTRPFNK